MLSFDEARDKLIKIFNKYDMEQVDDNQFRLTISGEKINVIFLKTNLTGSDRPKPQIRVFTDKIRNLASLSMKTNEKLFCFIHCSHSKEVLKFNQLDPCEYIVSLESDWNDAGDRIDVRSIYDRIQIEITKTPLSYLKINQSQHSTPSVRLASVFKLNDEGLGELEQYLKYFDSRLVTKGKPITTAGTGLVFKGINKIYYGAPGTGKSYAIQSFIREKGIPEYDEKTGHPNVFRTTLHPEYTYYDFVGQVMPIVDESSITYNFVPKVFTRALSRAIEVLENEEPVFLILEEMSRANVSAVFGDLFQLLDRNVETGESEYRIHNDLIALQVFHDENKPIYLPGNLFIIGTVNTNDQNVFVMDTAFKRRFEFEYVPADNIAKGPDGRPLNNFSFTLEEDGTSHEFEWVVLYRALNRFITRKVEHGGLGLNEDKQIGQFFIKFDDSAGEEANFRQICGKLLNYLYDDIQSAAFSSGHSLFKDEIYSYGSAYRMLAERKNIFSKAFLSVYEELKKESGS